MPGLSNRWNQLLAAAGDGRANDMLELLEEGADIQVEDEVRSSCLEFVRLFLEACNHRSHYDFPRLNCVSGFAADGASVLNLATMWRRFFKQIT